MLTESPCHAADPVWLGDLLGARMIDLDPLWCAWFSGFVDGEGCFYVSSAVSHTDIVLSIRTHKRDTLLLEDIRNRLDCGHITYSLYATQWRVRKLGHIVDIIVPLLEQYPLRSSKRHDFIVWRQIARLAHENIRQPTSQPLSELINSFRAQRRQTQRLAGWRVGAGGWRGCGRDRGRGGRDGRRGLRGPIGWDAGDQRNQRQKGYEFVDFHGVPPRWMQGG